MWIFVWVSISAAGVVTSDSIPFPTREACEAGMRSWGEVFVKISDDHPSAPMLDFRCIEAATGKAPPRATPKP